MVVVFLPSCEKSATEASKPESDSDWVMEEPEIKVGEYNKEGRLVFWQINAFDHAEPFILQDDYGVMLINEGGEESPKPLYILARQSPPNIITTSNFEEFSIALSEIPSDAVVGSYGTCSVPRTYGLPDHIVEQYGAVIEKLESTNKIEEWTVCYCPNR